MSMLRTAACGIQLTSSGYGQVSRQSNYAISQFSEHERFASISLRPPRQAAMDRVRSPDLYSQIGTTGLAGRPRSTRRMADERAQTHPIHRPASGELSIRASDNHQDTTESQR